jgi:hypothetical protein
MAGIRALRSIRLGRETTAGSAVAAAKYFRGTGTIEDQREVTFVEEDVGYLSGLGRVYTPRYMAALSMDSTPATFEQLPYILSCGVKQDTAGEVEGSGYKYTFTFPTTATNTIDTVTIEAGDDTQAEEMEYAFVQSFTLEGNAGEALMMSADWVGRQVATCTFTTTATIPSVEEILFSKGTVYIDAVTGTMGTTEKSCTLLGMNLSVNTGLVPVYAAGSNLYFCTHDWTMPEITCELTFRHDATGVAEIAAWKAETPRQISIKFEGTALTTAGTTFDASTLAINMAGLWESFGKIDEQDGLDVVSGTFRARYDSTCSKFAEILVCNLNSTMGI